MGVTSLFHDLSEEHIWAVLDFRNPYGGHRYLLGRGGVLRLFFFPSLGSAIGWRLASRICCVGVGICRSQ